MSSKPLFRGMRARGFRRAGAALLAMAFLSGTPVDALVHRSCAHHDAPVGAADHLVPSASPGERAPEGSPAGAHGPGAHAEHSAHEEHDSTEHGPCTCLGACQSATATGAAAGSRSSDFAIGEGWHVVTPPVETLVVTRDLARLLPFANGPPRTV